jgi:hypothetical protein
VTEFVEENDDGKDKQEGHPEAELLQSIDKVQNMLRHPFSLNQSRKPCPILKF